MSEFKDHFSGHASLYGKYRPVYPEALYQYLASISPSSHRAWDCATGNGQAAQALVHYFDEVIATDASEQQIQQCKPNERIQFRTAPAESSGIQASSIDLVTVAQALHWFDHKRFFHEVNRVLVARGVIAAWTYSLFRISPAVDEIIFHLYKDILGDYWPPERQTVEQAYRNIEFPYEEITTPEFHMETEWNLEQVVGYLRTWSAVQYYIKQNHKDPLAFLQNSLEEHWGDKETASKIHWPLSLRVGRKTQ